jgi:DNA polymerase III subunit epsilon
VAAGYSVVDVETTGLHPGWHHRIVEVAVVELDRAGRFVGEWCTLVNPDRDLGPQHIHGITAAEARDSPRFADIAGDLGSRLAGRMVVGHNVSFDLRFLAAEFALLGEEVPLHPSSGLCTMGLSGVYLAANGRSLATCCEAAGVELSNAHSALHDAKATAELLACLIKTAGEPEPWLRRWEEVARQRWPVLPPPRGKEVRRGTLSDRSHFLARLVDGLPKVAQPVRADEYLAVLDRALLDRHLSATEQDELVETAVELGLTRGDTTDLHQRYLTALAIRAWEDEVVTDAELQDLRQVSALLGLPDSEADNAVSAARQLVRLNNGSLAGFRLRRGDSVVFTGQMRLPREEWTERAQQAGLGVHNSVTKSTKVVVAADPDSLSGKAKKAHTYKIPVITEDAFESFLDGLPAMDAQR